MTKEQRMRQYIDEERQRYRSPMELPAQVASFEEARALFKEGIKWAMWNNMAVQDYLASECHTVRDDELAFVRKLTDALKEVSEHLRRGSELGLTTLQQRVLDSLWGWVPHPYNENEVACARAVSEAILRLVPGPEVERTEESYGEYLWVVIPEIKRLADAYDMEFDTTAYNLSLGYFEEWLSQEFGLVDLPYDDDDDDA